ncbi:MAG: sigma-54-dependent Fis family transcriptional regulator [Bacteriovoracaceae bacterium]|nr:sigma-54-dependent Fis family transcriptional regulator [Bacteriovoracaceae bacterium]
MNLNILVVDDDPNIRNVLSMRIKDLEHQCREVESVTAALSLLESERFDLILTDYKMDDFDGLYFLHELKNKEYDALVVMMTAFASIDKAVSAVKEGAFDFIPKPFNSNQIRQLLQKIEKVVEMKTKHKPSGPVSKVDYFKGLDSKAMAKLQSFIDKVAPTEATILLTGESGTGKSFLAKEIHDRSKVCDGPFVEVHCTTLPSELIESELFGHEKGSFTGATKSKKGKIQEAEKGTLFLDEIGELPPSGQAKLLRFLQEKYIDPVGSNKSLFVDTRIIAATNKNLLEMVKKGLFREDLYYRLNMFECLITPLRDRREDVPILINKFLRQMERNYPTEHNYSLEESLQKKFYAYAWPGNIRELKNAIERLCYLSDDGTLKESDLPENYFSADEQMDTSSIEDEGAQTENWETQVLQAASNNQSLNEEVVKEDPVVTPEEALMSLEQVERRHIKQVLEKVKNLDKASEILGITTVTLWRKRKQYGIA